MKKRMCTLLLSAALLCSMCALVGCNSDNAAKQAYVSLDINPAIELIVDKNNNVVSVRGENEDGQILLYGETGIEGAKIDVAIEKITDLAVQYGYLDENNKVVDTLVTSGDKTFASEILGKVNASITTTAANAGLTVTTDGAAYSLLRRMDEVKKQYPNNPAIQSMSVQQFKLALSVSETGEISLEAAIEMDDAALIAELQAASAKIETYATDAYNEAKAKADAAYEKAIEAAQNGVYTKYYLEKALTHPMTAYYGGVYQMYASAAKGFDVICDLADRGANARKVPLDEAQVEAVATALGLTSTDVLKNADGDVTVETIEAYADKCFKNSAAGEALQQTKAALTQALAQAESALKEQTEQIAEEYKPQIESAVASAREVAEAVKTMTAALPASVQTVIAEAATDLQETLQQADDLLADGKIDRSELREIAARLDAKANEYRNKIELDLSDEEIAEIEERKAAVASAMTAQKQAFDRAMDEAAKTAKEYLAACKEARKPAEK